MPSRPAAGPRRRGARGRPVVGAGSRAARPGWRGRCGSARSRRSGSETRSRGRAHAMMPGDDLQTPFRLGAERQAFKALVAGDGLREPLEHGLGHRAGVDILLPQGRGVNLPEFQAVAEFQNSLWLDYGLRACGVSLSRASRRVFTACGFWAVGELHRAHSRATLSLPDRECLGEGPLAGGPLHLRLN